MNKTVPVEIALSLGGNLGDVPETFRRALTELKAAGLDHIRYSSLYRTPAVGCKPGTNDFINAAATGTWSASLQSLHKLCKMTEVNAGRPEKHVRFDSRPLDIDIIFFGSLVHSDAEITVPHKEARKRLFVLIPLAELLGGTLFPGSGSTVDEILDKYRDSDEFKLISATQFPLSRA